MNNRLSFIYMLVGNNRTGKSVLAEQIAKTYKENKIGKVVAFDPQDRFMKWRDEKMGQTEEWAKYMDYSRTLFIVDDYRMLCMPNTMHPELLALMALKNERGLDFIFICHHPKLVLERLTYYVTHYLLFYTGGSPEGFGDKIPIGKETVEEARDLINRYVKKYGRGTYPTFPYLYLDAENEQIDLINMPHARIGENNKVNF